MLVMRLGAALLAYQWIATVAPHPVPKADDAALGAAKVAPIPEVAAASCLENVAPCLQVMRALSGSAVEGPASAALAIIATRLTPQTGPAEPSRAAPRAIDARETPARAIPAGLVPLPVPRPSGLGKGS